MALKNATLATSPTSITVTGGTAVTFGDFGSTNNAVNLAVTSDSDFRLRRKISAKVQVPKSLPSAPNGYSQARESLEIKIPKLLANGKYTENAIQISLRTDVETTDAEKQILLDLAAQTCFDADFSSFWKAQSLA